ncbi:MAG: bifunctional riboflavin kinase/FAD synthetase [Cryomorphaceae bacterium]|nr:bifunctional riboflavin kinase/FAD synthetase [Cryomorphaceae bacterium]
MQVYYSIEEFPGVEKAVLTTGTFDGVHFGHRCILDRLQRIAGEIGGESVLLTFHPHPRSVLQPEANIKLLNTLEEKIERLRMTSLNHLIIHPFTIPFSQTSSKDFIRLIVEKIGVKRLVIGYDHHFGHNREGSFSHLKKFGPQYGFTVEEIPVQELDEVAVSSTKVRNALSASDVEQAAKWLGYAYGLRGKVVHGEQLGHQLGFPTANIVVDDLNKRIPGNGVYAVEVRRMQAPDSEVLHGMCNIGNKPTLGKGFQTIEVHIFDFNERIYGERLDIRFVKKLRTEEKFSSLEGLREQLKRDEVQARMVFSGESTLDTQRKDQPGPLNKL